MTERFKTRIVANRHPQILGFDCCDVQALTIPMAEIKLLLGICAHRDMYLFHMDTTTGPQHSFLLLSQPGELIIAIHPLVWILVLDPMVFLV
jgi:hypothetical protein